MITQLTKSIGVIVLSFLVTNLSAQLTQQGYATNVSGGITSGTTFSTDFSAGDVGGSVANEEGLGFYLGFPTFNLESASVAVSAVADGQIIPDPVTGLLLRIEEIGNYDTLDDQQSTSGSFSFNPVFIGDYLVNIDSDPTKYVATYFGDAFEWENADILTLTKDSAIQIAITEVPPDTDGQGIVSGTIEEDFAVEDGRIEARRRAARRKCGLKKRRSGGRTDQDDDGFDLIAYGETNENGEFEYGFLPVGTYRFFVEYPGIPINETSFVEFDVGEAGISDDSFVLAVFVTEEGIDIELVLGITSQFFTDFDIYPNPTQEFINIRYDKILSSSMMMEIMDMEGKKIYTSDLPQSLENTIRLDISSYPDGHYFIRFVDHDRSEDNTLTFRFVKR